MPKLAFSTIACPQWSIAEAASAAAALGYSGIELRTAGFGATDLLCDPAHTDADKLRRTLQARGVAACALATDISFDEPIAPPIIGRVIGDNEKSVRMAKRMVSLAVALECPVVRVFAFRRCGSEPVEATMRRIVDRLKKVVDHADRTGVAVAIENGGDFLTARSLGTIIDRVASPLLVASYSPALAKVAGENPARGTAFLASRLALLKVRAGRDEQGPMPDVAHEPWPECFAALPENAWVVAEIDRVHRQLEGQAEPMLRDAALALRRAIPAPVRRSAGAHVRA